LDSDCRGFSRRRLLDLGLTPSTRVEVALENTFGDPRAFRVRGTLIALRDQQAGQVWVKPLVRADRPQPKVGAAQA
jgi:Fe2+ transport system protein FeoA